VDDQEKSREFSTQDRRFLAETASGRAAFYDLLLDIFVFLPVRALVSQMRDGLCDALVLACGELGGQRLRDGAGLAASYRSHLSVEGPERALHELSVDRTGLIGGTWDGRLRPPYERLYTAGPDSGGRVLSSVRTFYRKGGLLLEDDAGEAWDFLFVELDFMKRLCLLEAEAWSPGGDGNTTQSLELRFLSEHPGRWTGVYCAIAGRYARTDFYRGFLTVLDAFIVGEMAYLEEGMFREGTESRTSCV
jgi:TorA maturation chaperone TorD